MTNAPRNIPTFSSTSVPSISPMFRRSSYASVVSGTANANSPQNPTQPTRSGAFAHLINTNTSSEQAASSYPFFTHARHHSHSTEVDGHYNMASSSAKGVSLSNMNQPGNAGSAFDVAGETPLFFIPSYLKGSRHAERLHESHRAKLAVQRDTRSTHSSTNGSLSTSSSSANLPKIVPSHRGMTHDIIERVPMLVEETLAHWPTRWNDSEKYSGLEIDFDGLGVRFIGMSKTHDEAASVRANHTMPRQCGIYYYEVTVVSKSKEGLIGIGFSGPKVPLNRLPGWEPESWAYHGDDGQSFCCASAGKTYGPKFSTLDVIGCGVNFRTGCAFFTKNGVNLGVAFRDIKSDRLYPSIGMKKPGEHIRANFGQTPFVFDIDSMIEQEKLTIQAEINRTSVASLQPPFDETALIQELISQYFAHDGYIETARAFAQEVSEESNALSNKGPVQQDLDPHEDLDVTNRQKIRAAILDGDIDSALKLTSVFYPSVLSENENENIYFKLRCRKFIEMIRKCTELQTGSYGRQHGASNGQSSEDYDVFDHQMELDEQLNATNDWERMETEDSDSNARYTALLQETIQYGQELQLEFSGDQRKEVRKALEDTFALIAYRDARESSLAPLLEVGGRMPVAEELNGAILVSLGKSSYAAIERLYQQTEVLVNDLNQEGGAGAFVNVRKDFLE